MSSSVLLLAALRLTLRLDVGLEYDSNANRAEVIDGTEAVDTPTGSPLLRTSARGMLAWRKGANLLRLSATLGGKIFFLPQVADQNMLVGQLAIDERVFIARRAQLGIGVDYYDAGQLSVTSPCNRLLCNRHRDFRSGSSVVRFVFLPRDHEITLSGGYRGFQYKPEPGWDFQAAQGELAVVSRRVIGALADHEVDLSLAYHFERRWFEAQNLRASTNPSCAPWSAAISPCLPETGVGRRTDYFHQLALDVTYVGPILFAFGYAGQINDSTSFQQTFWRHIVTVKLGFQLPWQLYLTLKGQLMATLFRDPVLLDQRVQNQTFITAEDENRNAVIVDLERPIKKSGVGIYLRYSVYTNQLSSSPAAFIRHLGTVGLTYKLDGVR